jgi:hypothetical protein
MTTANAPAIPVANENQMGNVGAKMKLAQLPTAFSASLAMGRIVCTKEVICLRKPA